MNCFELNIATSGADECWHQSLKPPHVTDLFYIFYVDCIYIIYFFQVGPQCMLGEGSQMGDKSSVKRSVIGRHCRIGSNVKVL